MARSDTTTSSTPFSPFSNCSAASEATSDDPPDLGAFTDVFRALNEFQHEPRTVIGIPIPITQLDYSHRTPTSSLVALSPVTTEANAARGRSGPPFLSSSWRTERRPRARSLSPDMNSDNSDTEGEELFPETVEVRSYDFDSGVDVLDEDGDHPSLGYLDEALGFIAAERAKFFASRDAAGGAGAGNRSSTSDSAFRASVQSRKKRKKKAVKSYSQGPVNRTPLSLVSDPRIEGTAGDPNAAGDATLEDTSSSFESSSSPAKHATPVTARVRDSRKKKAVEATTPLLHSKSTPSLRLTTTLLPLDPRVLKLRALAHKLRLLFPEDASRLSSILSNDQANEEDFVDPRGPKPQSKDTLIHVFIDHSNILIGFLSYLRRHPAIIASRPIKHLSHPALALILERGRSVTRRVLVTSSPLYQPVESAIQLGYEVRIYARVPDMRDGMDRNPPSIGTGGGNSGSSGDGGRPTSSNKSKRNSTGSGVVRTTLVRGHARNKSVSGATTSENSDGPNSGLLSTPPRTGSGGAVSAGSPGGTPGGSTRVRYREQGVDELLQLKLHQAIADVDVVPPNATIVLATGDGNAGQFNEEGFLGCVRTALKKGWRVELYAWEGGLSRAWKREFSEGPHRNRFSIHGLSKFGQDLLEV